MLISQRNLVHSTGARFAYYREPITGFLLLPSFAFDSSVAVIFWTLCRDGGRLVLTREGLQRDPLHLTELITQHRVSHVLGLPSLHALLLAHAQPGALASLRAVIVAGEACPKELVERHQQTLAHAALYNEYGPTEGTVWSTVYDCSLQPHGLQIPIGGPVANMQVYILDEQGRPVPVAATGELHIGGPGLARGYLNRPELTAEKFIPNSFCEQPGARLYRTGDLARWLPDGNVEFQGRVDEQVKIRGYRIELGEIETVLCGHAAVAQGVVIAREEQGGEKRLVAYVVAAGAQTPTVGELRGHLQAQLPDYMLPSAFVFLPELPLTSNGKVDKRALPAPDSARPELAHQFVAPRTPVEEMLCGIWAEVLGVERVGIHDNFFELGGHSLLATQMVSRVRHAFHLELPLRALFDAPTVAQLAQHLHAQLAAEADVQAPPLQAGARREPLPLSFAQQRLWFLDQLEPESPFYNIPLAVRLNGQLNQEVLARTLTEILRRHEVLRSRFATVEGRPTLLLDEAEAVTVPTVDLSGLDASARRQEAERLAAAEAQRPFDLSAGPLWRVHLLKLGEEEHVLLFSLHHIVTDGWSMGVLVREVSALYDAFSRGETSPLPELPIQYADYAVWQQAWLSGEVLGRQLEYWRGRLAGAPAVLELPTDRPRPAVQSFRGAYVEVEVGQEVSAGLVALGRHEGVTLYMTLLAAFQVLLSKYSGSEDVVVGSPIAGRTRKEVGDLIGF
ncbi:MAG TPA: condensation domain-containing protein, partial [Pyrinomonadaceae bacterium]